MNVMYISVLPLQEIATADPIGLRLLYHKALGEIGVYAIADNDYDFNLWLQ